MAYTIENPAWGGAQQPLLIAMENVVGALAGQKPGLAIVQQLLCQLLYLPIVNLRPLTSCSDKFSELFFQLALPFGKSFELAGKSFELAGKSCKLAVRRIGLMIQSLLYMASYLLNPPTTYIL